MKRPTVYFFAGCAVLSCIASAQTFQRQAAITGGNSPDQGRCTVQVVVDDVAQIEIRGAAASLRTVSGQPPQWRRFECSGVMPANPNNFRFQGVDGRGRQTLVRDPRQGGVAVVEIDDKEAGAGDYTFEILWDSRGNGTNQPSYSQGASGNNTPGYRNDPNQPGYRNDPNQPGYRGDPNQRGYRNDPNQPGYRNDPNQPGYRGDPNPPGYRGDDRRNDGNVTRAQNAYRPDYRNTDYYRRYGHGFATNEAVRLCEQAVDRRATQRFRAAEIHFDQIQIDDNPGREDWVIGSLDVHRGPRYQSYNFACSVNFNTGQIRSAQLDATPTRTEIVR